jgi:hypothetical protein
MLKIVGARPWIFNVTYLAFLITSGRIFRAFRSEAVAVTHCSIRYQIGVPVGNVIAVRSIARWLWAMI